MMEVQREETGDKAGEGRISFSHLCERKVLFLFNATKSSSEFNVLCFCSHAKINHLMQKWSLILTIST